MNRYLRESNKQILEETGDSGHDDNHFEPNDADCVVQI